MSRNGERKPASPERPFTPQRFEMLLDDALAAGLEPPPFVQAIIEKAREQFPIGELWLRVEPDTFELFVKLPEPNE
jgi:hypothetical protein